MNQTNPYANKHAQMVVKENYRPIRKFLNQIINKKPKESYHEQPDLKMVVQAAKNTGFKQVRGNYNWLELYYHRIGQITLALIIEEYEKLKRENESNTKRK